MVTAAARGPVVAVLGLGEAGSVIARDLLAAGAAVRGYDPAVPATPRIVACRGEAEAARDADLVLSEWLREHIAAELTAADARSVERIAGGTARHALRRAAEMQAAAGMLAELGVQPTMADGSRALHERLLGTGDH